MGITLKDLAKHTGLAISTVSMALNDHPRISPKTKVLVRKTAKELGYAPHPAARALALKKTLLIGLVIEDVFSSFYPEIIQGVEDVAEENSLSTILCSTSYQPDRETAALSRLLDRRVDGIIMVPHANQQDRTLIDQIQTQKIPLVCILRRYFGLHFPSVRVDNESGGYLATRHLIEKGHRRIGVLKGASFDDTSEPRFRGYLRALWEAGIEPEPHWAVSVLAGHDAPSGCRGTAQLLDQFKDVTALFAMSDFLAMGALMELRRRNMKVPQHVAVVGFDGLFFGGLVEPSLTTIGQPRYEIGELAANMLLQRIHGKNVHSVTLQPKLIPGGTT